MNTRKITGMCRLVVAAVLLLLLVLPTQTAAARPFRTFLFDLNPSFEDPFKIIEQGPVTVPKSTETLALARCDWKETPTVHVITVDMPGLGKEDVKVEVAEDDRLLTISGERKAEAEVEGDSWHRAERTVGKFWRQFRMPGNADVEGIKAHLESGVLTVTVPKVAGEKARQTKVIEVGEGGKGEDVEATKTTDDM